MLGNKAINTLLSMDYLHEAPFILIYTIALPLSALVSIHFSSDFSEKNSAIQGKEFQRPEEATPTHTVVLSDIAALQLLYDSKST